MGRNANDLIARRAPAKSRVFCLSKSLAHIFLAWGAAWTFAGQVYFGNNGDGSKGGGIYECTPNNGNWETTGGVTCSLVVLDQALNDRNDGLNCLPAMTGDNPFTQFTD